MTAQSPARVMRHSIRDRVNRRSLERFALRRGPILVILVLLGYLATQSPLVLSANNIWSSLVQAAPIAVVSFGLALVVMGGGNDAVNGGIDLSIPAGAALATVIIADQLTNNGTPFVVAFAIAVVVAVAVGCVNAFLVSRVGLPPILATLGTYVSVVGISRVVSQNRRINVDDPVILWVRDAELLGVRAPVVLMVTLMVLVWLLGHRSALGMRIQASGGSRDAAESAGINVRRTVAYTYVLAGAIAGIAAVLLLARGSGSSPGIDEQLLVDMVLATFVGAAFSPRNAVTVPGAMLGAILVALLSNALILNRVSNSWVDGWKGVLILVVVIAAAFQTRERK
jgi:ribose transport system permease protein